MRALALVLVLFFHAGYSWMPAGYMGVSVFFTLSGFLITNLLLTEFDSSNGIRLGNFYSRRWKRLLPAGLLCLVRHRAAAVRRRLRRGPTPAQ